MFRVVTCIFVLAAFFIGAGSCCAQHRIVVLKNGSEIEGTVKQDEIQIEVVTTSGSRLILTPEKVDFICNNLQEAYWEKVARLGPLDVPGHIDLFHWCLKREFFTGAKNQIKLLMEMEISAIKLDYLNQKLVAEKKSKTPLTISGLPSTTSHQNRIQQVNFEAEAQPIQPTRSELIEAANSLTPESIRFYKRKIEPLLVRSCYTAECHSSSSNNEFLLQRVSANSMVPKSMSQFNLYHVLQEIDRTRPFKSPLFVAATEAHADDPKPILRRGSKQFENLRQWLVLISSNPFQFHSGQPAVDTTQPHRTQINRLTPRSDTKPPNRQSANGNSFASPPDIPDLNKPPEPTQSTDPFDPNEFNKKFGSENSRSKEGTPRK